jgi:hypothetical protein
MSTVYCNCISSKKNFRNTTPLTSKNTKKFRIVSGLPHDKPARDTVGHELGTVKEIYSLYLRKKKENYFAQEMTSEISGRKDKVYPRCWMEVRGQRLALAALPLVKRPGTLCLKGWMKYRADLDGCRNSRPHRHSIRGHSIP